MPAANTTNAGAKLKVRKTLPLASQSASQKWAQNDGGAHPDTTTKAGGHANRNAGFIRQEGKWHWGCRMNPAFR